MGIALLVLILSVVSILYPRGAWYLSSGWRYKDVEPSTLVLTMNRGIGILGAIVSIIIIINGMSNSISTNNWPNEFVQRLQSDQVTRVTINVGFDEDIQLDREEAKNIAEIIENVNMTPSEVKATYGYSEAILIEFEQFNKATIYCMGDQFILNASGHEYDFISEELEAWVSEKLEK